MISPLADPPLVTAAATVAPIRDGVDGLEVLLLRRNPTGTFAGMWVFPGGRIDDADMSAASREASPRGAAATAGSIVAATPGKDGAQSEIAAARHAASREAYEEAGLRLDPAHLAALSWWLPPAEAPRRFATWFFVAATARADVLVDGAEVHDHVWVTPAEAMARRDRGEIVLVAPTWMTLRWLSLRSDTDTALGDAMAHPPGRFVTRVIFDGGRPVATLWEGDEGYDDGNLQRSGPRRRLMTDPSGWRFEGTMF